MSTESAFDMALQLREELSGVLEDAKSMAEVNVADNGIKRSVDMWRVLDAEAAYIKINDICMYLAAKQKAYV